MAFSTYGELRQELLKEGIHWTVNPALSDNTPIRRPSLGGILPAFRKRQPYPGSTLPRWFAPFPPPYAVAGGPDPARFPSPTAQTFVGTNATPTAAARVAEARPRRSTGAIAGAGPSSPKFATRTL